MTIAFAAVVAGAAGVVAVAAVAVAAAVAMTIAFAAVVAGAVWLVLQSMGLVPDWLILRPGFAVAIGLVYLVLPVINALLDWPSWLVSRWLATHLRRWDEERAGDLRFGLIWLPLHVVVDLVFAIFCLWAVLKLVPWSIDLAQCLAGLAG